MPEAPGFVRTAWIFVQAADEDIEDEIMMLQLSKTSTGRLQVNFPLTANSPLIYPRSFMDLGVPPPRAAIHASHFILD